MSAGASAHNVILRIEGVGRYLNASEMTAAGNDGRYRFCSRIPASPDVPDLWRDYLTEFPTLLSERITPTGGFPELGALSFSLLDHNEFLTSLLRIEAPPATLLAEDVDRTETAIDVQNGGTITSAGDCIWINREAMRVTGVSSNTLTVERGYLGTAAAIHGLGDYVYRYPRNIRGRRVALTLDIDGSEASQGVYRLDRVFWDRDLNAWSFEAASFSPAIHAAAPPQPDRRATVIGLETMDTEGDLGVRVSAGARELATWGHFNTTGHHAYVQIGDEVLEVSSSGGGRWYFGRRALAGTARAEPRIGDEARQVFVADRQRSSFRFSPGPSPSTSRASGTWTQSDHWVDILLSILMSSPDPTDDTWITHNYTASRGNWAALPAGYGLGIAHTDLSWPDWLAAKERTPRARFPWFVYGADSKPLSELAGDQFLRPLGVVITSGADGLLRPIVMRLPTIGSASWLATADDVVMDTPEISRELAAAVGTIVYELGPQRARLTAKASDAYAGDQTETLSIPGADPVDAEWLEQRLLTRLWYGHKPPTIARMGLDLADYAALPVGAWVAVTLAELPDLSAGTRGWSAVTALVVGRTPKLDGSPALDVELRAFGSTVRASRITPAAWIVSVATNTATIEQNRYTDTDAQSTGLPASDGLSFSIGLRVLLKNPDGTSAAAGYQTITDANPGSLTLDGNFSGAMAANRLLVIANYDDAPDATAQTQWAYFADKPNRTVDASSAAPFVYAEA